MDYDVLTFIARGQPWHNGHTEVVKAGLNLSLIVIVLIGSADGARSLRNPWTAQEREEMIRLTFPKEVSEGRLIIRPVRDYAPNERWVKEVTNIVNDVASGLPMPNPRIGLLGHAKDSTSFYLKLFPQWGEVGVANVQGINATDIRKALFEEEKLLAGMMPPAVCAFIKDWAKSPAYRMTLKGEHEAIQKYKKQWAVAPYPPTFVTVDAVVTQSGHVLLVKRRDYPGRGLWALPGGFLNQNETVLEGCIRELREETKISVPDPVLLGSVVANKVFDDPHRSSRGRTITHAFHIKLKDQETLPKIKGSDDAEKARWVPLASLRPDMFEDHYSIVQTFTGI